MAIISKIPKITNVQPTKVYKWYKYFTQELGIYLNDEGEETNFTGAIPAQHLEGDQLYHENRFLVTITSVTKIEDDYWYPVEIVTSLNEQEYPNGGLQWGTGVDITQQEHIGYFYYEKIEEV